MRRRVSWAHWRSSHWRLFSPVSSQTNAAAQGAKPVVPIFEVDSKFPTMPNTCCSAAWVARPRIPTAMSGCFIARTRSRKATRRRTAICPLPLSSNSARRANTSGMGGPVKGARMNGPTAADCIRLCGMSILHGRTPPEWRRTSGQRRAWHRRRCKGQCLAHRNGDGDGQVLKFTKDGKFLLQIGKSGVSVDSNDTTHLSRRRASPSMTRPTRCCCRRLRQPPRDRVRCHDRRL